jgi:hypothetical protein
MFTEMESISAVQREWLVDNNYQLPRSCDASMAFLLLSKTSCKKDISSVYDHCKRDGIDVCDKTQSIKDLCARAQECKKYDYDYDEQVGHNFVARDGGAEFIYVLNYKSSLTQEEKQRVFNTLRFIFTHDYVFNMRFMRHCYNIALKKKHFFSSKQWKRLSTAFQSHVVCYANEDSEIEFRSCDDDSECDYDSDYFEICDDCGESYHSSQKACYSCLFDT